MYRAPEHPIREVVGDPAVAGLIARSGVPPVYRSWTWERMAASAPGERALHDALRDVASRAGGDDEPNVLAVVAPDDGAANNGAGKTLASSMAVLDCCRRGVEARIVLMIDLLDLLREKAYVPGSSMLAAMREWVAAPMLVIDDIDKARSTADEWLTLFRVIDKRTHNFGLETVLITNLDERALMASVGESVNRRVTSVIACDWPSHCVRKGGAR